MKAKAYFPIAETPANEIKQPPRLLNELLGHALNMLLIADQPISAHRLHAFLTSVWHDYDPKLMEENTVFNEVSRLVSDHAFELDSAYFERSALTADTASGKIDAYLEGLAKNVPENKLWNQAYNFLCKYVGLDKERRSITDLAFSGLLFNALNDPDFAALCKDKDLDASAASFEQKMHEELDHEALYRYLQGKLGVA